VQYSVEDGRRVRLTWNPSVGAAFYRVYRSDGDVGILAESSETTVDISQLSVSGDGTPVPTTSDPGAPPTPTGVTGQIVYGREASYVVSAISEDTGEESLPSTPITLTNDMGFKGNRNSL